MCVICKYCSDFLLVNAMPSLNYDYILDIIQNLGLNTMYLYLGSGCTDKIPDMCPQWKSEGLCDDYRWDAYMDENCAKTCERLTC